MSLFTDVMEGYIGGYAADTQLDAATEADIDARITDDAYTVSQYTGECFYDMMACEAALYAVEGRCSVNLMHAKTESAKAQAIAAMEASISAAVNKVKELASRAWEAVKKFIKKVWQKIKGFAATLRNAFKKFSESIDQSKLSGLKVKWQNISPEGAYTATTQAVARIESLTDQAINNNGFDDQTLNKNVLDDFRDNYGKLIYGGNGVYDPKVVDATSALISQAIKIADLGYDKYFNNFLKLGEKTYNDTQKEIKELMSENQDKISDTEDSTDPKGKMEHKGYKICQRALRICLQVVQEGTNACKTAIQQMFSLAVKACRAAVRYSHGDKTATTKESYTNFDETLARIL
jgi:hypothetical protein